MSDAPGPAESAAHDRAAPRSMQVADRLRESILSGEIGPGERMNEAQLSARLGVSRTPTRAALHALAAEGLLDYETNRGFTVRSYSAEAIAEAYEIRAVLEGLAARLAARRPLSAGLQQRFEAALAAGDAVVAAFEDTAEQRETYRRVNVAFHDTVLAAAANPMLDDTLKLALARPATTLRNIVSFTRDHVRRRHDDHHRIHEAIRAGDEWRAEMLMRAHVASVKAEQLERRGRG